VRVACPRKQRRRPATMAQRVCDLKSCTGRSAKRVVALTGAAVRDIGNIWGFHSVTLYTAPLSDDDEKQLRQIVVLEVRCVDGKSGEHPLLQLEYDPDKGVTHERVDTFNVQMAEKVAEHQFSVPLYSHRIADLLQQWLDTPPDDPYQAMAEFPEAIIDACGQGAVMEKHFEEAKQKIKEWREEEKKKERERQLAALTVAASVLMCNIQ